RLRNCAVPVRQLLLSGEREPIEAVAGQRQLIRQVADRRKGAASHELDRDAALGPAEIELDRLRGAGEVEDAEHRLVLEAAQEGEDLAIAGIEEFKRATSEDALPLPYSEGAPRPVEQARGAAQLRFDIYRREAVDRV